MAAVPVIAVSELATQVTFMQTIMLLSVYSFIWSYFRSFDRSDWKSTLLIALVLMGAVYLRYFDRAWTHGWFQLFVLVADAFHGQIIFIVYRDAYERLLGESRSNNLRYIWLGATIPDPSGQAFTESYNHYSIMGKSS